MTTLLVVPLAVLAVWLMATYRAPETTGATPQEGADQSAS